MGAGLCPSWNGVQASRVWRWLGFAAFGFSGGGGQVVEVPGHGAVEAGPDVELGGVSEEALGFTDIGLRVPDVAFLEIAVGRC